jgi:fumarate reductase subunit D
VTEHRPAYAHAFWWAMFSQGGMIAAVMVPAVILMSGILGPLKVVPYLDGNYKWFAAFVANWLGKLFLFVLISLPMFHAAHRFHFWLHHIGVHAGRRVIPMLSYATAALITLIAAVILVITPG